MKKGTIAWLIVAAIFIIAGGTVFVGAMTALNWDFSGLSTFEYEEKQLEITEEYQNITVRTKTANVVFELSKDDKTTVYFTEQKNLHHTVTVTDGSLTVEVKDTRKWYEHIGISLKEQTVRIVLPMGSYGKLAINNTTGDVTVPNGLTFESAGIQTTTGGISLKAAISGNAYLRATTGEVFIWSEEIGSLSAFASTGSVSLYDTEVKGKAKVEVGTGDVLLQRFDATEIEINTSTGDVRGSLASGKQFDAKSGTGKVRVPENSEGGSCKIYASTGNIDIKIA